MPNSCWVPRLLLWQGHLVRSDKNLATFSGHNLMCYVWFVLFGLVCFVLFVCFGFFVFCFVLFYFRKRRCLQNTLSCLISSQFLLSFISIHILQHRLMRPVKCWCMLPVFIDELDTEELLQPTLVLLLLCLFLFIVKLLPEVLLGMEGLFVNSFGVSLLDEICRGWGFNVLLLCQKYLNTSFKYSIVIGFFQLLCDFILIFFFTIPTSTICCFFFFLIHHKIPI